MTAQQQQELARKHALVARIWELKAKGYSTEEIQRTLNVEVGFSPKGGNPTHGYCSMGLWKEPESEPNWCGPGSGTAVISNWRSVPPSGYSDAMAYMTYLAEDACKQGQTSPNCTGMIAYNSQGTKITRSSDWIYIVNHEIGTWWYEKRYPKDIDDYKYMLEADIYWCSHPLNNSVETKWLPSWGAHSCAHYVAANRYSFQSNEVNDEVKYGDSAPNSATGYGNPFGWHWIHIDTFYNEHIDTSNGGNLVIW
ncbi:MAG: hypothetical protein DRI37_04410 [Chloroflexi bacterium]|nr:MAG: hypothetical protein DRI37_04410 [Chloroflexota bacterium]